MYKYIIFNIRNKNDKIFMEILISACSSTQELRERMTDHRQQTRNPHLRMIPLSKLDNCSKNKTKPSSVFPFYKFQEDANEIQRTEKQADFIKKYKPKRYKS